MLKNAVFGSLRAAHGRAISNGCKPFEMWTTRESRLASGVAETATDGLFSMLGQKLFHEKFRSIVHSDILSERSATPVILLMTG